MKTTNGGLRATLRELAAEADRLAERLRRAERERRPDVSAAAGVADRDGEPSGVPSRASEPTAARPTWRTGAGNRPACRADRTSPPRGRPRGAAPDGAADGRTMARKRGRDGEPMVDGARERRRNRQPSSEAAAPPEGR